jgi:hypothetical protein
LFDGVARIQTTRERERTTDGVDRKGSSVNNTQSGVCEGQDALGVHIVLEQFVEEISDLLLVDDGCIHATHPSLQHGEIPEAMPTHDQRLLSH